MAMQMIFVSDLVIYPIQTSTLDVWKMKSINKK